MREFCLRDMKSISMFNLYKKVKELERDNKQLNIDLALSKMKQSQPEEMVRLILKRGIDWYDYQNLDKQAWLNYYNDIQQVVNSEAFNNEVFHFLKDMMEKGFTESADINQLVDFRTG